MKQLMSAFLSLVLVSAVVLPPQVASAISAQTIVQAIKVGNQELKMMVMNSGSLGRGMTIQLVDSSGNVVKTFIQDAASPEVLAQMMPSKIAARLIELGKKGKTLGKNAGALAAHEAMQFPAQSFGFFLAIGATVAEQVIFNYSQDPVGFEHFINGQLDPVGQFSFYTFMLANGASSQAMMSMLEKGKVNRRLAPFVPYLGMSLGMIASNITSEALHSDNFKACAMDIATLKGFHADACDKAAKAWNEGGGMTGLANQWAPGLISLVATTIATSAIQSGAMMATSQIIKIAGIELATFFVPGGIWVKSIRAVGFVAQLTLFTKVNNVIDPFFTKLYQNFSQSGDFNTLESSLVQNLSGVSAANWKSARLNNDLTQFATAMKTWRAMNLIDVSMAQSSWVENLNNFAGLYNSSKSFYTDVISEVVNQKKYPTYSSALSRNFPLNGITPKGLSQDRMDALMNQPDDILQMQLATVKDVSQKLDQIYGSNQAYLSGLSTGNREVLTSILAGLRSQDIVKIGQAMERLNFKIKDITESTFGINTDFVKTLKSIKALLGNPKPIWGKSAGYATYFLMTPEMKSGEQLDHQVKFWFNAVTYTRAEHLADWLMASTVWGPDVSKGEKVTDTTAGFYSQFLAPRLPLKSQSEFVCNNNPLAPTSQLSICDKGVRYDNPLNFVVSNLDSKIADNSAFASWWQKNAETPYVQVWVDFENKYQEIVSKLMSKMWVSKDSATNRGDISNGIVTSATQELKLYALTLGGIMKAQLEQTQQTALLNQMMSKQPNRTMTTKNLQTGERAGLMTILRQNNNLDLRRVLQTQGFDTTDVPQASASQSYNFAWQNTLLTQLAEYTNLLRQIKPQKIRLSSGKEITAVSSQITNAQFQEQQQKIQETLKVLNEVIGTLGFSAEQQKTAKICLKNMDAVVQELTTMAMVANSVSYHELTTGGQMAKARCSNAQGIGKGMQFVQRAAEGCAD